MISPLPLDKIDITSAPTELVKQVNHLSMAALERPITAHAEPDIRRQIINWMGTDPQAELYVNRHDTLVRAMGHMSVYGGDAFLHLLSVKDVLRGQKLGSRALRSLMDIAATEGADTMLLRVGVDNHRARDFYQQHEFVPDQDDSDYLLMSRTLFERS